jgi:hypothetical protein
MEDFLHAYFGWSYVLYLAYGLLFFWMFFIMVYFRKRKTKEGVAKRPKKWWFWVGTILISVHLSWITFINPSYFGYGTPDSFYLIQVNKKHIILYDRKFAYVNNDSNNSHEESIPNLRIHVIDRELHKKVHWELIGDYYFPLFYGSFVVLKENNTYSSYSNDNEIQSLKTYDADQKKVISLVEQGGQIMVDGKNISVHDILYENTYYNVKSSEGDRYRLNPDNLQFEWYVPENFIPPEKSMFRLSNSPNSPDKQILYVSNEQTEHVFLSASIVNEMDDYLLIYSENDLTNSNPKVAAFNEQGALLWEIDLNKLKDLSGDSSLEYIHRTLLVDEVCYITSNEFLFEFDLQTGKLNWMIAV